jgi:hypothetical protein
MYSADTSGCVNNGRLTVDIRERNPFFGTMLENEYAYQSYYSETAYFISGLVRKILGATAREPS